MPCDVTREVRMPNKEYEMESSEDVIYELMIQATVLSNKLEECSILCKEIPRIDKIELKAVLANGLSSVLASNMVV